MAPIACIPAAAVGISPAPWLSSPHHCCCCCCCWLLLISRRCALLWTCQPVDAVSRVKARSDLYEMDLTLDINVDVFPGGCCQLLGGWVGAVGCCWVGFCLGLLSLQHSAAQRSSAQEQPKYAIRPSMSTGPLQASLGMVVRQSHSPVSDCDSPSMYQPALPCPAPALPLPLPALLQWRWATSWSSAWQTRSTWTARPAARRLML